MNYGIMKKGIAVNSLAVMILLLIVLLVMLVIVFSAKTEGSNLIKNFFGVLGS